MTIAQLDLILKYIWILTKIDILVDNTNKIDSSTIKNRLKILEILLIENKCQYSMMSTINMATLS